MSVITTTSLLEAGSSCLDFLKKGVVAFVLPLAPSIEAGQAFAQRVIDLERGVKASFLAKGASNHHREAADLIEESVRMVLAAPKPRKFNQMEFLASALEVAHAYRKAEAAAPRSLGVGILFEADKPETIMAFDDPRDVEKWRQDVAARFWNGAPDLADSRPGDALAAADAAFARVSPFSAAFRSEVVHVRPGGHAPAEPAALLPTMATADLSTGHLSPETLDRLQEAAQLDMAPADLPVVYDKGGYGFLIHVDPALREETLGTYPEDLQTVLRAAGAQGCGWIMFDGAGPIVEALPTYGEDAGHRLEM